MYNLFVWILLLGYAPSKTSEDEETTPIRGEQELLAVRRPAREYQASNVSGYRYPQPLSSHSPPSYLLLLLFDLCRFEQHDDL
jgi:hypothetical protein